MNLFIFISCVFGNTFLVDSPYFYDNELDKMCLEKIADGLKSLCNPVNSIIIDENIEERTKQLVFVGFGYTDGSFYFFTKGKERITHKNYEKYLSDETLQKFTKKILKKIKKEYKIKDFDIYFTINTFYNGEGYLNKENSIDLITEGFKKEMSEDSVVRYFPYYYQDTGERPVGVGKSKTIVLKLRSEGCDYVVFIHKFFLDDLFNNLENLIKSHQERIFCELKSRFEYEQQTSYDFFVLSVFYRMNGDLRENLTRLQFTFLFNTWKFLKNKVGFYDFFIELFDNVVSGDTKSGLDEIMKSCIEEDHKLYKREGYYYLFRDNRRISQSEKYYLLMNFIELKANPLAKNTSVFITRIFSLLSKNYESLARIIFSDKEELNSIFYKIEEYNFGLYKSLVREMIPKYPQYLQGEDSDEPKELFEYLTTNCLEAISEIKKEDMCVLGPKHKELFEEFINKIW